MPTPDGLSSVVHNGINSSLSAANLCREHHLVAAVVIIYATIDAIAGLHAKGNHREKEFTDWTRENLLGPLGRRDSNLANLGERDIWIARNTVLHSFSSLSVTTACDSRVARLYYVSKGDGESWEEWKPPALTDGRIVRVCVDDLFEAMREAVSSWRAKVVGDPELLRQVNCKGRQFFSETQFQNVYFRDEEPPRTRA